MSKQSPSKATRIVLANSDLRKKLVDLTVQVACLVKLNFDQLPPEVLKIRVGAVARELETHCRSALSLVDQAVEVFTMVRACADDFYIEKISSSAALEQSNNFLLESKLSERNLEKSSPLVKLEESLVLHVGTGRSFC